VKKSTLIALCGVLALSLAVIVGLAVWKTEAQRIQEIEEQAVAGDPAAQLRMGQLYWHGNVRGGLEPNPKKAEQWLQMAAGQGHQPAQHVLGAFYQSAGDDVGAYAWLSLATMDPNDVAAQLRDASAARLNAAQLAEAKNLMEEVRGTINEK